MSSINKQDRELVVVFIFDPILLQELSIDELQKAGQFDLAVRVPDGIILGNSTISTQVSLQANRLEINNSEKTEFKDRDISGLVQNIINTISSKIPHIKIKALGLNLFSHVKLESDFAADWITKNFLGQREKYEEILSSKIIGNATRIFYGTPEQHHDLRFSPIDLTGNILMIQQHFHEDLANFDTREVKKRIASIKDDELIHLNNIMAKLFNVS